MSVLGVERYRVLTGDTTSAATAVEVAIADAQNLLEGELRRGVENVERTERLKVHPGGRVYPSATPITDPGDYTAVGDSALDGASPSGGPWLAVPNDTYADVTYTGGWDDETVPACIERDLAWAAAVVVDPSAVTRIPAGSVSVSLGDAAVTFDRPRSVGEVGIAWSMATMRHRRRFV